MTSWPAAPAEAAFHGPAGEFVLRTEPHTEAHPMALLAQFLVAFGTACGRGAHYAIEADRHYPNEFCVLVGPSAKGRKGIVMGPRPPHPHRGRPRLRAGAASPAGSAPARASSPRSATRRRRRSDAPADKRRLVLEQEFAQVLKVLSREGNTLSPIVRQAWDGDALQTMVRNNPLRASAAHIGIVGHITKDELLRYLTATELANGFLNRFLLIAVDRSKLLPFGSALDAEHLAEVRDAVARSACASPAPIVHCRWTGGPRAMDRDLPANCQPAGRTAPARRQPAPKRTSSGSRSSTRCWTARTRSASNTSTPALPSGATAPPPPPGSSATGSATRPPTRSGRPPRNARLA